MVFDSIKLNLFKQPPKAAFYFGFHVQDIIRPDVIPPAGITASPDICDKFLKGFAAKFIHSDINLKCPVICLNG